MDFCLDSKREVVVSDKAPLAIGPYSHVCNFYKVLMSHVQGIKANGMIFVSGCIGINRETKALVSDSVVDQARRSLENMKYIVEAAGSDLSKVVKCTVFLTDMANFASVNAIYAEYFPVNPPARSCVAVVGLPAGAIYEVECIALE